MGRTALKGARAEARAVWNVLSGNGFELVPDGDPLTNDQARLETFLAGIAGDPWVIHFSGHGSYTSQEPVLLFAGDSMLAARGLPERAFNGQPLVMLNACVAGVTQPMGGAWCGLPDALPFTRSRSGHSEQLPARRLPRDVVQHCLLP